MVTMQISLWLGHFVETPSLHILYQLETYWLSSLSLIAQFRDEASMLHTELCQVRHFLLFHTHTHTHKLMHTHTHIHTLCTELLQAQFCYSETVNMVTKIAPFEHMKHICFIVTVCVLCGYYLKRHWHLVSTANLSNAITSSLELPLVIGSHFCAICQ